MKQISLIFLFFFTFFQTFSQLSITDFDDTEIKKGNAVTSLKVNNNIIIAGQSSETSINQPSLICIDSLGNLLWNSATNDTTSYAVTGSVNDFINGNDGFLYACVYFSNSTKELWKVDVGSGAITWKKDITSWMYGYGSISNILNFDANKFIISYSYSYNGSVYNMRISSVNKSDGNLISTAIMGDYPWMTAAYDISLDDNNDIYYSKVDSLYKLSGVDFSTVIWRKKYSASDVKQIQKIYCDTFTQTVYFIGLGNPNGHKIVKLNSSDGSLVSTFSGNFGYTIFEDFKAVGNHFYFTWSHEYVGGSDSYTRVAKYNIVTETLEFTSLYNFPVGSPSFGGDEEAVRSLDIDDAGDIFVTGYFGDANYGPANWGILKIDGTTGDSIYSKKINLGTVQYERSSSGISVMMFNNTPCFIGNLQSMYNTFEATIVFVSLDNQTGAVSSKKNIGGELNYQSKTIDIQKYNSNQTVVFKQIGRGIKIEMYDSLKQIIWERELPRYGYYLGSAVSITPSGKIICAATRRNLTNTFPFYSSFIDSNMIFELDANGQLLNSYSFYIGLINTGLTELVTDDLNTFVFYQKNNTLYFRKINSQVLSNEINTFITYVNSGSNVKYCWNKDANSIYIFGKIGGVNQLINLTKSTNTMVQLAAIPNPVSSINYITELDAEQVIISGKTITNNDYIAVYNTSLLDTIWTSAQYSNDNSEVIKCLLDVQHQHLYSISLNNQNILTKKLAITDGSEKWGTTYNGTAGLADFPLTISYDGFRDQIIVAGYELDFSGKKSPTVLIFDTVGTIIDTINLSNEISEDASALCSHILPDGSQWIGGNRNLTIMKKTGFILESAGTYIPGCIPTSISINTFSMPSGTDNCLGAAAISLSGLPDFNINMDNSSSYASSGYTLISDLCPGIHDLLITDNCSDTLNTQLVIPVDSNYIEINPFIDSIAVDSLGVTATNCEIYYNSIDTVYIDSLFNTANSVTVIWTIFDSNGQYYDTSTYNLDNGNGVYFLQLNLFCPNKILGNFFTVTQAIYYNNGSISMATILEATDNPKLNIFPNPFKNDIKIDLPWANGMLMINDALGRQIVSKLITKHSVISLEQFDSGLYFVQIQNGDHIYKAKIIKE